MNKTIVYILHLIVICGVCACSRPISKTWAPHAETAPKSFFRGASQDVEIDSRARASMNFTDRGRDLIARGQYDDAIQALERAISLDPDNGRACYYMSEAFLSTKNIKQADEFNRLAERYIPPEALWNDRLKIQKEKIEIAKLKKVVY